jgi:hypothetical protein
VEAARVVCVLGAPRSGTSLATMVLHALGTFFGESDRLDKPYDGNPKGSWEHLGIERINQELLARFGGTWHEPPELAAGWECDARLDDLKASARSLLAREFGDVPLWGWKDPPTCLTLPFWRTLVPQIHHVICLRSPLDVARSLERRDRFPMEKGLWLWLLHIRAALQHTAAQPRLLLASDRWIDDWHGQLDRVARFVTGRSDALDADAHHAVEAVIDRTLWHHRSATSAVARSLELYESLVDCGDSFDAALVDRRFKNAIGLMAPHAAHAEASRTARELRDWTEQRRHVAADLDALVPSESRVILVDQAELGYANRQTIPFLERDGEYAGPPADDMTAIREFERLNASGADFIAFAWPAFWWLESFSGLNHHLRSRFRCVIHNERLVAFDLKPSEANA